jgi:glucosylceramidase
MVNCHPSLSLTNRNTLWSSCTLVVDRSSGPLIETAAYYVFRHYSQFILPGATRIGTSGTNDALAFQNADGSIVTEVYSSGGSASTMYQFDVPGHGWATRIAP